MAFKADIIANWAPLSQALDDVLSLPKSDRVGYVLRLRAENPDIAVLLEHLLSIGTELPVEYLEQGPALDLQVEPLAELSDGDEVGGYRLLKHLGRGGMGSLWIGERADGTLKRKVALKLPRMPWIEGITAQLASERDILCELEHPNIARLYDAGLDASGQPFFAMEYIEGDAIDDYCNKVRLSIRARVTLFLQVLEAVQFAHTRLIIHRDIKPANILVNTRGEARLLDFGIAQLQPPTLPSPTNNPSDSGATLHALTLRYASPEQIRRERLTLVADIYSLGVTLYELLLGRSPYDCPLTDKEKVREAVLSGRQIPPGKVVSSVAALEARQITCTRLQRMMNGDLGAVIEKALKRDPTQRYASAEAFAADLKRWLELKPVLAVNSSPWRSISKFAQRNPWSTGVTTCSMLIISALAIIATLNAERARAEFERANATKEFLLGIFDSASPELHSGREISARELLSIGEQRLYESLKKEPDLKVDTLNSLIQLNIKIENVESARRLARERSEIYITNNASQLAIESLIDEMHLSFIDGDFNGLKNLINKTKELSSEKDIALPNNYKLLWYEAWVKLAYKEFESAYNDFKKIKEISEKKQLLREKIESVRGMATAKYRAGDFDNAFDLIDSALREISTHSGENDEVDTLRLELITDLYIFGEYFRGWKWVVSEINSKYADKKIPKNFEEIWIKWCIKLEKNETLLEWVSDQTGELSGSDESVILLRAQVLSYLQNFDYARLELYSLEHILENKKKSIDYLITKFELDLFGSDDSGLKGPSIDPAWAKINRQDEFYRSYYSGLFYAHQGDFLKASEFLDIAYHEASEVLGEAHPTVANLAFSALVARGAGGAYFPSREEIEPLLSVMGRSYGFKSRRYVGATKWMDRAPDGTRKELSSVQIWGLHDPRL